MKYRTPCPACDDTVSLWRVWATPMWLRITCSRCKSRLTEVWTPAVVAPRILAIIPGVAVGVFVLANGISLWYLMLLVPAVVLFDLLPALLIVNKDLLRLSK